MKKERKIYKKIKCNKHMKIEEHKRLLKESLEEIQEAIEKGLIERQRSLAFHVTSAIADYLEIYLHMKNLIDPGFVIKHDYFRSEEIAKRKLPWSFPYKEQIIKLAVKLERKRDSFCYGKKKSFEELEEFVNDFLKLKRIFEEKLGVVV